MSVLSDLKERENNDERRRIVNLNDTHSKAVVTAYLNSIKHEFDENNPDTWPKKDGPILLFRKDQAHCVVYIPKEALSRMDLFGLKNGDVWVYIADIMPEENK